jgi:hypothetical protein
MILAIVARNHYLDPPNNYIRMYTGMYSNGLGPRSKLCTTWRTQREKGLEVTIHGRQTAI